MTRLRTADIADIVAELDSYDAELVAKTGCTLGGIACRASGIDEQGSQDAIDSLAVAVVPMTCNQGVIHRFADAVRGIVTHIGFRAVVTRETNVAGLAEALEKASDVIMLADDHHFVALGLRSRRVVDNADATGKGYVAGLSLMSGGLQGRRALVIGCGRVGQSAAVSLVECGAQVSVYDIDRRHCHGLAEDIGRTSNAEIRVEKDLGQALRGHQILIDATPAPNIIHDWHITPETCIASPGVPHGLSSAALRKVSDRFLHDPLQIGVATMIMSAASQALTEGSAHTGASHPLVSAPHSCMVHERGGSARATLRSRLAKD